MLAAQHARATYSIAGADAAKGEVGSAGASCVPYEVILIYRAVPGVAVIDAQAYFDTPAQDQAEMMLANGASPDEVLAAVTDASMHPDAPKMQYGIVDAKGRVAAATGPEAMPYASHLTGFVAPFAYAIQGNILTSQAVLDQAEAAFLAQNGCDLAERLMLALEAGAANGEGDSRCTPEGRPAKSAFLDVTSASGTVVHISLPDVSPDDPVVMLRAALDAWRADHPCPSGEGGSGGGSGGGGGAGGMSGDPSGCSCSSAGAGDHGASPGAWIAGALGIAVLLRSRRREGRLSGARAR